MFQVAHLLHVVAAGVGSVHKSMVPLVQCGSASTSWALDGSGGCRNQTRYTIQGVSLDGYAREAWGDRQIAYIKVDVEGEFANHPHHSLDNPSVVLS